MSFWVYILYSANLDRYYLGQTEDIELRLLRHNSGRNISTRAGAPWVVMYTEEFQTRVEASRREVELKAKKSRKYLEWLISKAG